MLFFDAEMERRQRIHRNKMHTRICQTRVATNCRDEGIRVMERIAILQDEVEKEYIICRTSIEGFILLVKQCYNMFMRNEVLFSTAFQMILTVNELLINVEVRIQFILLNLLKNYFYIF